MFPTTKRTALSIFNVLHQNGVVEGPMHYGSGETVSAALDSHNGTVGSGSTTKRPKSLVMKRFVPSDGGGSGGSDGGLEGGSLPCTPELLPDTQVNSCPAGDEVLESDTRELLISFIRDYNGLNKPRWRESKPLSTMKRVVGDVLEKHRYAYNGMINKLSLDDTGDDVTFVSSVAKNLFADGMTNWGRVVSLLAFGAVVSQHLKEKGRENCVELVGQEIATYLLSDQRDWLVKNNAWDGFVEFFRVADPESSVRNTLMAVAGFAGIGATLALLIR
ncbi:hypothetical protein L3Q82_012973 [Scortum barcoo]|uniref:Uncharacterized protein n=1 Tax=Scortum barcoo TaxID=214431 RepID=A0ACB8VYD0_9TELE|nr:hypothetical protein L3Q82_012973 [Scortum barcoo]